MKISSQLLLLVFSSRRNHGCFFVSTVRRRRISSTSILFFLISCLFFLWTAPSSLAFSVCSSTQRQMKMIGKKASFTAVDYSTTMTSSSKSQQRRSRTSSSAILRMHMGHSHSHHDHHHNDHDHNHDHTTPAVRLPITTGQRIRHVAMYVFCACFTLVRPIIQRGNGIRSLASSDYATFIIASLSFRFFFEPIRRELKHAMNKINLLGRDIAKHAPPPSTFFSMTKLLLSNTDSTADGNSERKTSDSNNLAADRVTILGGFVNVLLSGTKFFIGVTCHSSALIADAGHSLSDLFSDFVTLWAVQVGRLPPDDDHPYGHGKFESIGALFLALILLGTGLSVGIMSNRKLIEIITLQRSGADVAGAIIQTQIPTYPALIMAGVSIAAKEWLYRVTVKVGQRINSQVVIANAWHHRSDAYSSVLALFSIGLAMAGLVVADAAAGLLVAGMICMTGAEILGESVKQLTDTNDEKLVKRVREIAANSRDVASVNRVRARQVGSSSLIDLSVSIPENKARSVSQAREIEERLRVQILQEDGVLDVDVKAVSVADTTICSKLMQQQDHLSNNSNGVFVNGNIISKAEVEACVRDEILQHHPEVQFVKGITIHYQDIVTNPIDVDVDICLQEDTGGSSMTIAGASMIAENVRQTLERSSQIHKASIFLDLNSNSFRSLRSMNQ